MILNNKVDNLIVIGDDDQPKKTMAVSASAQAQAHMVKILTDYSYKKKIESAIRETVSNAIDSHIQAGIPDKPVIVRLKKKEVNGSYYLEVEDFGLGLDTEEFDKYIMQIGESTKQDNPYVLGMFGAGAKSPLSKVNSFYFVCRKDGIERRFTIYKTSQLPERSIDYEKETTESNGVLVHIDIPPTEYIYNWTSAMREQLCYFPNIVYDIDVSTDIPWNSYKIFRSEDFEWSELCPTGSIHISLQGVYYPLDWNAIGVDTWFAIDVPIALKFSLNDGIRPTFSREELQYDDDAKKIIINKIKKVAEWFQNRYNETVEDYDTFIDAYPHIGSEKVLITLEEKEFNIKALLNYAKLKVKTPEIKNIKFYDSKFYKDHTSDLTWEYDRVAFIENGNWKKTRFPSPTNEVLDENKVVVLNSNPVGNFKTFLRTKYFNALFVVRNRKRRLGDSKSNISYTSYRYLLGLTIHQRHEWRDRIKEWQYIQNQITDAFENGTDLERSDEYKEWLQERKEALKEAARNRVSSSSYKSLNKQKGEITVGVGRRYKWGGSIVFDKTTMSISKLHQKKMLTVYFLKEETKDGLLSDWIYGMYETFKNKVDFVWVNEREVKYVKNLKNWKTKKQFMESKPLSRYITAIAIDKLLNASPDNEDMIYEAFPKYRQIQANLEEYKSKNYMSCHASLQTELLQLAENQNLWDGNIYNDILEYKKILKDFGFLNYLKETDSWRTSDFEKKIIKNMMYIILKHNKVNAKMVEDFTLIPNADLEFDFFRPATDKHGEIKGHEGDYLSSVAVWKSKDILLKDYPNCIPVGYKSGQIIDPEFMDDEKEVKLIFNAELWTVEDTFGNELKSFVDYPSAESYCLERGFTIIAKEGLDDDDEDEEEIEFSEEAEVVEDDFDKEEELSLNDNEDEEIENFYD